MRTPPFWYHQNKTVASVALKPFSVIYECFSKRHIHKKIRYRAQTPVICVGNLTAGGSGKTPIVRALASLLKDSGKNPHILSRGYRGKIKIATRVHLDNHTARDVGDEPLMHAHHHPSWISENRVAGAKKIEQQKQADFIIMDDGFQNPYLYKDIRFIVVDGQVGFGNECLIPSGPLRERIDEGIKRADALIIMGDDHHYLKERFEYLLPVFQGFLLPNKNTEIWQKQPVIGFTGIGRPAKFRQTLLSIGVDLKEFVPYADHHFFSMSDINSLLALAKKHQAQLVTTEKDWVRLPLGYQNMIKPIAVEVHWKDEQALKNFLNEKGVL